MRPILWTNVGDFAACRDSVFEGVVNGAEFFD